MPEHRRYVEPFMGAASVLMRKPRSHAEVINDLDGEMVNLFQVLRDRGPELREALRLTPFARAEFENSKQPATDVLERARRIVVRSFMGFSSNSTTRSITRTGFRGSSERSNTTPAHDWANYPNCMDAMIERLRGVVIENRTALDIIEKYDSDSALFYVDPPYVLDSRTDKDADYRHEMKDEDHVKLAESLSKIKGKAILSGYHSKLYDHLFKGWFQIEKAALADGAKPRVEVLWMNFQPDGFLF